MDHLLSRHPDTALLCLGSLFEALHQRPEREDAVLDGLAAQILDERPKTLIGLAVTAASFLFTFDTKRRELALDVAKGDVGSHLGTAARIAATVPLAVSHVTRGGGGFIGASHHHVSTPGIALRSAFP